MNIDPNYPNYNPPRIYTIADMNQQCDDCDTDNDESPITTNRFNNASIYGSNDLYSPNGDPYYASGTPSDANAIYSNINTTNIVPYNGNAIHPNQSNQSYQLNRKSNRVPHTNCPGSDIASIRVPKSTQCQRLCENDTNCNTWSYNNNNQQCHLKRGHPHCRANGNYTSGHIFDENRPSIPSVSPSQPSQPSAQPVKVTTAINNVTFPLTSNSKYLYANSVQDCMGACMDKPNCNQWVYNPNAKGPACLINQSKPSVLNPQQGARGGNVYIVQSANQLPTKPISSGHPSYPSYPGYPSHPNHISYPNHLNNLSRYNPTRPY